jgi:hypothetical protein
VSHQYPRCSFGAGARRSLVGSLLVGLLSLSARVQGQELCPRGSNGPLPGSVGAGLLTGAIDKNARIGAAQGSPIAFYRRRFGRAGPPPALPAAPAEPAAPALSPPPSPE